MGEFFRGWRRKMGAVTLLLALATACAWLRGRTMGEALYWYSGTRFVALTSRVDSFEVAVVKDEYRSRSFSIVPDLYSEVRPAIDELIDISNEDLGCRSIWTAGWGGFSYQVVTEDLWEKRALAMPCWSIAIPLTAASVYLLLGKPRAKRSLVTDNEVSQS